MVAIVSAAHQHRQRSDAPVLRTRHESGVWPRRLAAILIGLLLIVKVMGYVSPGTASIGGLTAAYSRVHHHVTSYLRDAPYLHGCRKPNVQLVVPGGWICANGNPTTNVYRRMFRTYPAGPAGRNAVYTSTTEGSDLVANNLMAGIVDMPRYAPVRIGRFPRWNEDPYHAVYWRLNYYALRPTQSLLAAFVRTGDTRYARRLVELDKSFFARAGDPGALAWQDAHAVSFRAMILIDDWWRLRQNHALSESDSVLYLRELERTGQYLADPNHYQPEYNHGTNEAAALLDIGLNFPLLPNAHHWLALARQRLSQSMNDLVDQDGALIENSPYYHFYTLDKYWQIQNFAELFHYVISPNFRGRLLRMINYASYILEPDGSVPLLGASLSSTVNAHGSFAEMARMNPYLDYVLTRGAHGSRPPRTSVFLAHAGQTIMRSGWGRGTSFAKQSFLTFNVGAYRTPHSHLDLLGITLYGNGAQLLSDAGLYSYAPGALHDYFHGTAAHNTVTVDGRDQTQGHAVAGQFVSRDGFTYQTAETQVYDGVTHRRLVMMIDRAHFLVIDHLTSVRRHHYRQMFHLAPGTRVARRGLTILGQGATSDVSLSIRQLDPNGVTASVVSGQRSPPLGLCSVLYDKIVPCPAVTYEATGRNARFATLLTIGRADPGFRVRYIPANAGRILVHDHDRTLDIRLSETPAVDAVARATDPTPPKPARLPSLVGARIARSATGWLATSGAPAKADRHAGRLALRVVAQRGRQAWLVNDHVHANLSRRNLELTMRVGAAGNLSELSLQLSNDHWHTTVTESLTHVYPARYSGEWLRLSLGRSLPRSNGRQWVLAGSQRFDWKKVDGVRFRIEASSGTRLPTLEVASISTMREQPQGVVAFVFDDGYTSILSAARSLHRAGMAGTVAVIGKYVELPTNTHLTVHELHFLQDSWGWNMVNHTQSHGDAVTAYWPRRNAGAYEQDIVDGAQFLQHAHLDSAPNWLIYPHGTTNAWLGKIVRRFYKFARTVSYAPEAFPFGDPHRVKTLEVRSATDAETGGLGSVTPPRVVLQAVRDAKAFHTTLILTFHRIHARASDKPGYPIGRFQQIVDGIKQTGIKVTTLRGLDSMMGVKEDSRIVVHPGRASQLVARVAVRVHRGGGVTSWLEGLL